MQAIWSNSGSARRTVWGDGSALVDSNGRLTLCYGLAAEPPDEGVSALSFEVHDARGHERIAVDGMEASPSFTETLDGSVALALQFSGKKHIEATVRVEAMVSEAVLRTEAVLRNTGDEAVRIVDPTYEMRIAFSHPRRVRWIEGMQIEGQRVYPASFSPRSIEWNSAQWGYEWNSTREGCRPTSTNTGFPYLILEAKDGGAFGGFEWSGLWRFRIKGERTGEDGRGGARLSFTIPMDVTLAPGEELSVPPVFAGVYGGDVWEASIATHRYLRRRVMRKREIHDLPWVQFNTWYSRSNEFTEEQLTEDLEIVSQLGFEVFMIDDGWFPCTSGRFGWGAGVGEWVEDPSKFPGGLARFGDLVRSKGMKLGLWIEPERVDMSNLDRLPQLRSKWLATRDKQLIEHERGGSQVWTAQLCYGCPEVVEWAKETFSFVIEQYRPDWIKWDHNIYGVCNRWDHGHGSGDGNYRHIQGVYEVFRYLNERFPGVTIENCSAGGTRADFGLLRYTDTNWVSDWCSPSHRSRSHFSGIVTAMPPEAINSFVAPHFDEPFNKESARYLLRSRMIGSFGFSHRVAGWDDELRRIVAEEIANYKRLRPILRHGTVDPLLPAERSPESWSAYQFWNGEAGVVFVFRNESHAPRLALALKRLDPNAAYRLTDADSGETATYSGASLAAGAFVVAISEKRSSRLIWIEAVSR